MFIMRLEQLMYYTEEAFWNAGGGAEKRSTE